MPVTSFLRYIALVAVVLTFASCSSSKPAPSESPDTSPPTLLLLLGEDARTITSSSALIVGTVSNETTVSTLTYTLNGGAPQDAMGSLNDGMFSLTIEGLKSGTNTLEFTATDSPANSAIATLRIEVTAPPGTSDLPALEGTWIDNTASASIC